MNILGISAYYHDSAACLLRDGRVVAAIPVPDYLDIAGHLLPDGHRDQLGRLRATGALCTLLEL